MATTSEEKAKRVPPPPTTRAQEEEHAAQQEEEQSKGDPAEKARLAVRTAQIALQDALDALDAL